MLEGEISSTTITFGWQIRWMSQIVQSYDFWYFSAEKHASKFSRFLDHQSHPLWIQV
jgi:hypothetical protein